MEDQKKVEQRTIRKGMARMNDRFGGKSAMTQINPQKPDQGHVEGTERPPLGGIRFVS